MNEFPEIQDPQNQIDFKAILLKYLQHWKWFLFSIFACLLISFLYLRYSTPEYSVYTNILIKGDKKDGGDISSTFQDLNAFRSNQSISNEIATLKGKPLMWMVMQELNLHTTYYSEGKIKTLELYGKTLPIKLISTQIDSSFLGSQVEISIIDKDKFTLIDRDGKSEFTFNSPISRSYGKFSISPNNSSYALPRTIFIQFNDIKRIGNLYNNKIQIALSNKETSVLNISLIDPLPEKAINIINKFIEVYQREAIEDKNQIAQNTVKFIDERLSSLVEDLEGVEKNVENFKKKNELFDVSSQANVNLQGVTEYSRQAADIQTQISVVESMQNYIRSSANDELVPGTMGIQDPTLGGLTQKYNELQLERQRLLKTVQPANPLVINLDEQLSSLKSNISESLSNVKQSLEINQNALSSQAGGFKSGVTNIPTIERNLLQIQRQQGIKEALYSYLLQKREESAIALASAISNVRIIDPAMGGGAPVKPNSQNIYLIGLLLGIILPVSIIFAKDQLNDKVQSAKDLEKFTNVPILGELAHSDEEQALAITKTSRTEIAELFRLIRTNLQFAANDGGENKVMLVTSSMTGEGKTFFSINIAASLALTGKKIVVLEFDIRKPKLFKDLGMSPNKYGITNYLVNSEVKIQDIIQPVDQIPGLFAIPSGPIPPNPSELLLSSRIPTMMNFLKEEFDYIVIDTSPVGQVADAFTLGQYADLAVYMVRYNYTFKQQMNIVKDIYENKKIKNLMVVMNDATKENGYGYGYGYGYGNDNNQPKSFKDKVKDYLSR